MKKRLGGLAIAVAAVIGFTSPAAAAPSNPIVITPGYVNVITTEESTTFQFTGCDGSIDFVLAFFIDGVEQFVWLGTQEGPGGSFTFTWPIPGTFKIIVNCFPDEGPPSTDFVFIEVVPPPPVATTLPPAPTTAPPVPTTPDPGPGPGPAPTTAAPPVPGPTTTLAGATTTSVVGALAPTTTRGASVSGAGALPATGQDNTGLLVAAGALLALGTTLVLVRRRPA